MAVQPYMFGEPGRAGTAATTHSALTIVIGADSQCRSAPGRSTDLSEVPLLDARISHLQVVRHMMKAAHHGRQTLTPSVSKVSNPVARLMPCVTLEGRNIDI
jgi:hypothetical protein